MRSKLFVPGSRPELFDRAFASAADAISFDLEDAVAPNRKDEARAAIAALLATRVPRKQTVIVRINPIDGPLFEPDLAAITCPGLDVVNLPKAESAADIHTISTHLNRLEHDRGLTRRIGVLANIETPRGLRLAAEVATADPRVVGLQVGFGDLFEPAGISRRSQAALAGVWLAVRLAAAEANIPAYDGAYTNITDLAGFRAEAQAARDLGFSGKSCIHPTQIATANAVFAPSAAEVARARQIIAAADEKFAAGKGAFTLDGVMIDEPFIARARTILAQAADAPQ